MKRLLITEDNESNRYTIRYLLDQNGYKNRQGDHRGEGRPHYRPDLLRIAR
jgi:CheY-like chemotaxis protein